MNVVILDTGCANLNSVKSAIARHGYEPKVSRDPDVVLLADKLFLPGVGTAQAAMDQRPWRRWARWRRCARRWPAVRRFWASA